MLVRRKFLEHYDIAQRYTKGRASLEWPKDMPAHDYFDQRICLPRAKPKKPILYEHQKDTDRRDSQFESDAYYRLRAQMASLLPRLTPIDQLGPSLPSVP